MKKTIALALGLLSASVFANPYDIYSTNPYANNAFSTNSLNNNAFSQNQYGSSFGTSTTYDYNSGNSYTTSQGFGGNTIINGFNSRTGSSWNTTIDANGNQRGMDSKGNTWNYNSTTGTYFNSNGKICTGKGASRICTGG